MNPSAIVLMFCLQFGIAVEHVSCHIQNVTLPVVIWHGMGNMIYSVFNIKRVVIVSDNLVQLSIEPLL